MPEPYILLSGLAIGESPRWHAGRLWFSNWRTQEIVAVDLGGNHAVVGQGPVGLGWATVWLPDGRLLLIGQELMHREPDGSMVRHADLSGVADHGWSEIVVDGRGNIYLSATHACSEAAIEQRCLCWPPTGAASSTWTR